VGNGNDLMLGSGRREDAWRQQWQDRLFPVSVDIDCSTAAGTIAI
jgi:hypothetical protein